MSVEIVKVPETDISDKLDENFKFNIRNKF